MRRVVAFVAAAALLSAAAPAEAKRRSPGPLRFAPKCAATKKRAACRAPRARGWRAVTRFVAPPTEGAAPTRPEQALQAPSEAPATPAGATVEEGAAPPPPPPSPACDPSPWLGVTAEDVDGFRLRLTRRCVPAGTVLFQFRNNDLAVHNLWVRPLESTTLKGSDPFEVVGDTPGETVVTASAQLGAGEWRLYCTLPGHEAMSRLVDVTPAG